MSTAEYRVCRATIDHLQQLRALWQAAELPAWELEKRLTEFQVIETQQGVVVGAVGLQIHEKQGRIHSEAFADRAVADQLRWLLWDRISSIAQNYGLVRLWTQERDPFWQKVGMEPATIEELKKLPPSWKSLYPRWLTLQLRDEAAAAALEREFALFEQAERQRTQRALKHARAVRTLASLLVAALLIFVFVTLVHLLIQSARHQPRF
ncbi:MAG: hypothetical protein NZ739_02720 [Verrucomicrobiae bacterium]|nr:hypothetical protein [Verrucomicrobiae bacterium]MCX7722643.1 hypothetical protein [Verrucomicrobiae bacterium]MDW7980016.1 hypothetical protein [Verrucomicrobiales bacterium]